MDKTAPIASRSFLTIAQNQYPAKEMEPLQSVSILILWASMGYTVVMLLVILFFVLYFESWNRVGRISVQVMASPFNIVLVFGCACLIGLFACQIVGCTTNYSVYRYDASYVPAFFFYSCLQICYTTYAWFRTACIVEMVFPKAFWLMKAIATYCPAIFLLQTATAAVEVYAPPTTGVAIINVHWLHNANVIFCGNALCIYETILIISFISFLRRTIVDPSGQVDPKFRLISKHGCFCVSSCYIAFSIYFMSMFTSDPGINMVFVAVSSAFFNIIFTNGFAMKVNLHRLMLRQEEVQRQTNECPIGVQVSPSGTLGVGSVKV
ncbi:hypothetical protein HDU80_010680 [Chytriomyces hyalinus]|nr:hypothetical protein HDU80_010680 [Chytriomyces hyalinus]